MELAPKRPSPLWFWGPNSIIVVYMDPLGNFHTKEPTTAANANATEPLKDLPSSEHLRFAGTHLPFLNYQSLFFFFVQVPCKVYMRVSNKSLQKVGCGVAARARYPTPFSGRPEPRPFLSSRSSAAPSFEAHVSCLCTGQKRAKAIPFVGTLPQRSCCGMLPQAVEAQVGPQTHTQTPKP